MKRNHLLRLFALTFFVAISFNSNSQTYQWAKNGFSEGYDYGNCITTDDSGNVYIAGQIEYSANFEGQILNSAGKHDILVGKYDKNGNKKWLKRAGGLGGDVCWGIGVDKYHNVYIAGEIEMTAGFGPGDSLTVAGVNDIFLVKLDAVGNPLWLKRMGSTNDDKAKGLAVDENGYCYVVGYYTNNTSFGMFNLNNSGGNDVFIAKYTPEGRCVWAKKAGGSNEDRGRSIALSPTGHLYVVGTFTQSITFNNTNYTSTGKNSAFIAQYDTSGNFQWARVAGACCDTTSYKGVACDASGNAYVIGYFMSATTIGTNNFTCRGISDIIIAKYSSSGNVLWANQEGGSLEDIGYQLTYDLNRNVLYTTGMYDYQADFGSFHLNSAGNRDAFLTAYDPNGTALWARTSGGIARDAGQAVACDTFGYIYQTGFYNTSADFDATHLTGDTLADFYVTKISPAPAPQPALAATALSATLMNCNNIQLSWTPGNGSNRIVIARAVQSTNTLPQDGNIYISNSAFGSGTNIGNANYVVYNGSGNSILVTGLTTGVEYAFFIYEYNGENASINYNTTQFASTSFLVNAFSFAINALPPSICPGEQTTLAASGGVSYQWSPSTGLSATTGNTVIASPGITTTYTVNGTNSDGCHSIQKITVQINPLPTIQFNNVMQTCENNSSFPLTGGNPLGGTYSGSGVSNDTFNPSSVSSGQHIVNYTYADANGCVASDTSIVFVNTPPAITMPVFPALCQGSSSLTLSGASPSDGVYSGNFVSLNVFNTQLAGPGTFPITYSYTDQKGCQNSGTTNLIVNTLPTASITSIQSMCENAAAVTLSANPTGGTFSGTGINSNTFTPSIAGAGNHTVTYTITDNNNCTNTTTATVLVIALLNVTLSTPTSVCINSQPITLSGGSPSGGIFSGTNVTSGFFNPVTAGAGSHTISYSVTDNNNCSNTASATIVVNALPTVVLSSFPVICANNQPVLLTAGTPVGGTYTGAGISNNMFNPITSGNGTFPVVYRYTDAHNCSNQAQQNLTVNAPPIVTLTVPLNVCIDDAPFAITGGNPQGGNYLGQNIVNGMFDPALVPSGPYTIIYTYTDIAGCKGTKSAIINVRPKAYLNIGQDTTLCMNNSLTLNAGPGFTTYHWTNGVNTQTNTINSNIAGTFNYGVTVVDGYSCSGTDNIAVTFDVCSGIKNIPSDYPWSYIYPNPFKSTFTMFSEKMLVVQIYDVSGRLLQTLDCKGSIEAGENLSPGVYFIEAIYNNSKKIQKVIKSE